MKSGAFCFLAVACAFFGCGKSSSDGPASVSVGSDGVHVHGSGTNVDVGGDGVHVQAANGTTVNVGDGGVRVDKPASSSNEPAAAATTCGDSCSCPSGACSQVCAESGTCSASCTGGKCTQECGKGATCSFSCAGGGCRQICDEGAHCTKTCAGSSCT
jgi:hypothetical protein